MREKPEGSEKKDEMQLFQKMFFKFEQQVMKTIGKNPFVDIVTDLWKEGNDKLKWDYDSWCVADNLPLSSFNEAFCGDDS